MKKENSGKNTAASKSFESIEESHRFENPLFANVERQQCLSVSKHNNK